MTDVRSIMSEWVAMAGRCKRKFQEAEQALAAARDHKEATDGS